jgi:hypothetical protein
MCLVLSLAVSHVLAAEFEEYPEFRYASGLPGGGYGVNSAGQVGFDGALQMNIPVGYTPSAGNYALGATTAAINGGFPTTIRGEDVNGTLQLGLGIGGPRHALWVADMKTGTKGESAYNLQLQAFPEEGTRPGVAIGVVDVFSNRSSSQRFPRRTDARSFFVAATRKFGGDDRPWWATVGFGNGRFNHRPFGGVSYQPTDRLKVLAEYDGWNVNGGAAYDAVSSRQWHLVFQAGVVDFDHATVSVTLTRGGTSEESR